MNEQSQNRMVPAARWALLAGFGVAAALLLPSMAAPESRVATGSGAALTATARVNFKIIIPRVLYVQAGSVPATAAGADRVSVMTNGHNATLKATLRAPELGTPERGSQILNGAAKKGIAQNAACSVASKAAGHGGEARQVVCTVSMP